MEVIYKEKQRFTQWWLWVILTGVTILTFYGAYVQLVEGRPWGNNPAPDGFLIGTVVFIILLDILMLSIRLELQISNELIRFRLFPFHLKWKKIRWDNIDRAEVVAYKPILEYGGWGIRYSRKNKGMAYTTSGNYGLKIYYKDSKGKTLLLGTSMPGVLKGVLQELGC